MNTQTAPLARSIYLQVKNDQAVTDKRAAIINRWTSECGMTKPYAETQYRICSIIWEPLPY